MDRFRKWLSDYGCRKLARVLNVAPSCVYNWKYETRHPSVRHALRVVELSNGAITLNDIYGAKKCRNSTKNLVGK